MTTPAQLYVDQQGTSVTDWLASFIEQMFGRVVDGLPTYKSQFGVEYSEVAVFLDVTRGHESMMEEIRILVRASFPPPEVCRNMTLVWRTRPMIYAAPNSMLRNDPSPEEHDPNRLKVRYRFHTLEGLDVEATPSPSSSIGHAN